MSMTDISWAFVVCWLWCSEMALGVGWNVKVHYVMWPVSKVATVPSSVIAIFWCHLFHFLDVSFKFNTHSQTLHHFYTLYDNHDCHWLPFFFITGPWLFFSFLETLIAHLHCQPITTLTPLTFYFITRLLVKRPQWQ